MADILTTVQPNGRHAPSGRPDGSDLLTGAAVVEVLRAAVEHGGGRLVDWELDHVDSNPNRSTTATYFATVDWPFGRRRELLGMSKRAHGPASSDANAVIFGDGDREVAVWLYPKDPDLPGLARVTFAHEMAELLNNFQVLPNRVRPEQLELEIIGYRPRRRAVLKVSVQTPDGKINLFVKVLRGRVFPDVLRRHQLLLSAGVPAPEVAAATSDNVLVLRELPGRPLARAIFDSAAPCSAQQLITILDSMPATVATLERRAPWADAVAHYSNMVAQALPQASAQLEWMTGQITTGLRGVASGDEPTHGDFHEGQLFVSPRGAATGPMITGMLDVDTVGPGRRVDDLACLLAHMSTVQRMNATQATRVQALLNSWVPVFDERVDPIELRLRAAAVIISLATGPYRGQEPAWEAETAGILDAAEVLIRQVK